MPRLREPVVFETTFGSYQVTELIGEGGAGRVYGGTGLDGKPVAIKVLAADRASREKRKRFKNEIVFSMQNRHRNVVTVLDHGLSAGGSIDGPFYVMPRYESSLRQLMKDGIAPELALSLFSQILDGVEAAHLQGVVHRDLKPENILYEPSSKNLVVADFGIAKFTEEFLATSVETSPTQRLANFQYAAPEQRTPGSQVGTPADVYALGLMLNEMFTGAVPQGTEYKTIGSVAKEMAFLDEVVARMLRQQPQERAGSIADIKVLIQRHKAEAVTLQRLSQIDSTVIPVGEIDDPSALEPPKLIDVDWDGSRLTLILDRSVSEGWVNTFKNPRWSHTSVLGRGPETFSISGNRAVVAAQDHEVQQVVDYFKSWLGPVTQRLRQFLEDENRRREVERKESLRKEREAEERRLTLRRNIRI